MKIFLSTILFISSLTIANAQVVSFPDPAFKGCVNSTPLIDLNKDGQIQVTEAEVFTGTIDCPNRNINSITGIEAFKNLSSLNLANNMISNVDFSKNANLKNLNITNNQVTTLDISKNLELVNLIAGSNKLSQLNVTKNKMLKDLWIGNNNIVEIDLSQNVDLSSLYANNNLFKTIDVSKNVNLFWFICHNSKIETLDLSNNPKLEYFEAFANKLVSLNMKNGTNTIIKKYISFENPTLKCIDVDDVTYSNLNWKDKDPASLYSTDCKLATSENRFSEILVFPNPTTNVLNFSKLSNIELYNVAGQKLISQNSIKTLDISNLNKGMYFVVIKDGNGIIVQRTKIIKD